METDLEAVIRDRNIFLSPADTKSYLQMTLKGLAYCHKKWVLHRYSNFFLCLFARSKLLHDAGAELKSLLSHFQGYEAK